MDEGLAGNPGAHGAPRTASALAAALADARDYTKRIYAHLTAGGAGVPAAAGGEPRRGGSSATSAGSRSSGAGATRGTIRAGCARPRASRTPMRGGTRPASRTPPGGRCRCPAWRDLHAYLDATLADTLAALARRPEDDRYFFELALYHEDMHAEALLMTLQTLALPAPVGYGGDAAGVRRPPAPRATSRSPAARCASAPRARTGSAASCSTTRNGRTPCAVAPFALSSRCVTNAEYARVRRRRRL